MPDPASNRSTAEWELMDFLIEQTHDNLYTIIVYTPEDWETLYTNSERRNLFDRPDGELQGEDKERIIQGFRVNAVDNREREALLDIGEYACSLHLFDRWILLQFGQEDHGVVLGYDPTTATNLESFVADCQPYIEPLLDRLVEEE
ncbi:MAG: hypothetical protein ABEH66_06410 [Halobacteriales archaeon]